MRDSIDEKLDVWARQLPEMDVLKDQIIGRIVMLNKAVASGRTEALGDNDLAVWQFKTLLMLRRQPPPHELSPSALADDLGLTRGALSARLSGLEVRGLIVREHDRDDRRRVRVRLTESGYRAVAAQLDGEDGHERRVLSALTDAEKRTLADLLRKLVLAVETPTPLGPEFVPAW